jgi:hypothetical protein
MAPSITEEAIVVYPKTWHVIGYIFASPLLIAAGVAIFLAAFKGEPSATLAARVVGLVFGGSLAIGAVLAFGLLLMQLIHPRPILSITDEGIRGTGGLGGMKAFAAWHEMTSIRLSGNAIVIDVKEPTDVMRRAGWPWRIFMGVNQRFNGAPIAIPSVLLPMSPQALASMIENRRAQAAME